MAIEIPVISVGAVFLLVVLLILLMCTSGQRNKSAKKDYMGSKYGLIYIHDTMTQLDLMDFLFCLSFSTPPVIKSRLPQCLHQAHPRSSSPSLPGPPGLFLIGNMMELTHDHLPIHLTELAQRYGNIYRLKCGNTSNCPPKSKQSFKVDFSKR